MNDPYGPAIAAITRRIFALQQLRNALEQLATERSAAAIAATISRTAAEMIAGAPASNGMIRQQTDILAAAAAHARSQPQKKSRLRGTNPCTK
jgi:hypothetical protein